MLDSAGASGSASLVIDARILLSTRSPTSAIVDESTRRNRMRGLRCLAPLIPVVQSAEPRLGDELGGRRRSLLDRSTMRCITVERTVKTVGIVIGDIIGDESLQMTLIEHGHVM